MSDLIKFVETTNDLDLLNEVQALIKDKIENIRKEELVTAKQTVKDLADRLGVDPLTLVTGTPKASKKGSTVEPTHQNPDNPKETWAGRGKHPNWLREKIENGANLDDFKIVK